MSLVLASAVALVVMVTFLRPGCGRWEAENVAFRAYGSERSRGEASGMMETDEKWGKTMRTYLAMSCAICAILLGSTVSATAQNSDTDSARAVAFVKNSAITTKIKGKLAAEHITSLGDIHVDTDKDGVVWLSGSVKTQEAADRAVAIARSTAHVKRVHSDIRIAESD